MKRLKMAVALLLSLIMAAGNVPVSVLAGGGWLL